MAAGATVVLVPEARVRFRHYLFQSTTTDQNGQYKFPSVTPGDYKLFAWSDVEEGIWFDPDFLKDVEARGQPVTVQAKDHTITNLKVQ